MNHPLLAALAGVSFLALAAHAKVVINEIFYNAPGDVNSLQWIELHNSGDQPADIGGWRLKKGAKYEFPADTKLPAGGYLVLALDSRVFQSAYKAKADGQFAGPLKRKGDRIELVDASGNEVDAVKFADSDPWPSIADGGSSSLERICPEAPGDNVANWSASQPDVDLTKPMGTPGKANSVFSKVPVPAIGPVKLSAKVLSEGDTLTISVPVKSSAEVKEVSAVYRIVTAGNESPPQTLALSRGDDGSWSASFSKFPDKLPECVVRIQVRATDAAGGVRVFPSDNDLQPAMSVVVAPKWADSKIPQIKVWQPIRKAARFDQNQFTPEDQEMFNMQNRFQVEASLGALWFSLALTNDLAPGQLATLTAILRQQFAERNKVIRELFTTDDFASIRPALNGSLQRVKTNTAAALRPKLSPAQQEILANWVTPSRKGPMDGFDVDLILRNWVGLDHQFFSATTVEGEAEETFRSVRKVVAEAAQGLASIRDEAKTAFQTGNGQDSIQKKVDEIRSKLMTGIEEAMDNSTRNASRRLVDESMNFRRAPRGKRDDVPRRERTAFLYRDPATRTTTLIDFVSMVPRSAGYKVHFPKGHKFDGMSSINLVFENVDRFALAEPFSFEIYRRVGMKVAKTGFARLTVDQNDMGYHVMIEQPNRNMLRRSGLDDGGNLYKANWRGETAIDMHEKKTREREGSDDLEALVQALHSTKGDAQWNIIRTNFDVPQIIDYYAVNMLLSHWDGYFNNYFLYHDTGGSGRWTMYPWDQDKACGSYDGQPPGRLFAELPLDYGSWDNKAPNWKRAKQPVTFMEYYNLPNASRWWRQPGWLSGPMLANPTFRAHFVARVKQLVETEFTEAKLNPILDSYAAMLADEVRVKAGSRGMDADDAARQLAEDIRLLKGFIKDRRNFLLADAELKAAGKYDPASLK